MSYPISDEASVARRKAWEEQVKGTDPAPTERVGFEIALVILKSGRRVCRAGWNGKGMWLEASSVTVYPLSGGAIDTMTLISMKTATGSHVPWLASVTDLMAEDWMVVP